MKLPQSISAFAFCILFIGCGQNSDVEVVVDEPVETIRSFRMGFTPWLYEASFEAMDVTYSRIATHGDIVKQQLHGGIPWQASLDQSDYHPNVEAEIQNRLDRTPAGMDVFLAIDSLNTARDALSPNWTDSDNQPREEEWAERSWSSPEVIQAYLNFSIDMITRFQPTHFEYGTEASELILNNPTGYLEYLVFAEAVHTELSSLFPDLKLMTSIALKSPGSNEMRLIEASFQQLMPYTDVLGISTYPYAFYNHNDRGEPDNLSTDWLNQVQSIAGDKPMALSETGWIAQDLIIEEFQYAETSDETKQSTYMELLLNEADDLELEFVIWWTVTDFDTLWQNELNRDPVAQIWKDIGLYDEQQNPRPALQVWSRWLNYRHHDN